MASDYRPSKQLGTLDKLLLDRLPTKTVVTYLKKDITLIVFLHGMVGVLYHFVISNSKRSSFFFAVDRPFHKFPVIVKIRLR